jgi:cellobiose transport system substrate-binding protein
MGFRRRRGLTAVAAILAGVLTATAACGGGDDDNEGDGGTAGGGGPVTLTVNTFGEFGYEALYKQYEASHPNVKIKPQKISSGDQYNPRLQQWISTGSGAGDVVAIEEAVLPLYMQQQDKFVNLADHGAAKQDFLDWKWKAATSPDGKFVLGLGTDIGPLATCYRKDLFKKAGLSDDRDEVSKLFADWNTTYETAKKFQAKLPNTKFFDGPTTLMRVTLLQEGGKSPGYTFFDRSNNLVFDSNPAVKAAFDISARFAAEKLTANTQIFTPEWISGIQRDKFAAIPCPAWMLKGISEFGGGGQAGKWDVAQIPGGVGYWGGSWLAVPKQSKHQKEAAELAKFLTNPESQLAAFAAGPFPSRTKYYNDPVLTEYKNPYYGEAPIGKIYSTAASQVKPVYFGPKHEDVRADLENVLLGLGDGKVKPEEAWQRAIEAAKKAAR